MGQTFEAIPNDLIGWLAEQPMFFVGTAPLAANGHINVSPKGMAGTFAVLGPSRVAYLEYSGSTAETIAHLRENGRIVLMFCAFTGPPRIVRLHGTGRAVLLDSAEFAALRSSFSKERTIGQRSIVVIDVDRVATSCGFAVPLLDFVADRDVLDKVHERRGAEYFPGAWRTRNARSIDGLPAMPSDASDASDASEYRRPPTR